MIAERTYCRELSDQNCSTGLSDRAKLCTMDDLSDLVDTVAKRCAAHPAASIVAADCLRSGVCGFCTLRAIGVQTIQMVKSSDMDFVASLAAILSDDAISRYTQARSCYVCMGLGNELALFDTNEKLYYA